MRNEASISRSWVRTTFPEELTPFPYKFFYWIDPWGVQWEMGEEARWTRRVKGIVG